MKFDIVSFSKISHRQIVEGVVSPCARIDDGRNLEIYHEIQYFKVYQSPSSCAEDQTTRLEVFGSVMLAS
jgi:hypothetical protein